MENGRTHKKATAELSWTHNKKKHTGNLHGNNRECRGTKSKRNTENVYTGSLRQETRIKENSELITTARNRTENHKQIKT